MDPVIRLTHIETLLLLCTTFFGREYLRNHGVYEVVRALHNSEQDDKVRVPVDHDFFFVCNFPADFRTHHPLGGFLETG